MRGLGLHPDGSPTTLPDDTLMGLPDDPRMELPDDPCLPVAGGGGALHPQSA